MKIYAIYSQMVGEPVCYVEAENIDDLIKIMSERETYGMFPGWSPVEITKQEMSQILNRFNEDDIVLVDADKREAFSLFAGMQFDDRSIIEELKKHRLFNLKYSVNLSEKDESR